MITLISQNKMNIKDIGKPVSEHISEFNKYFKSMMKSDVALLNLILKYITRKSGKQVRPTVLLLAAEMCGKANQRSYVGAAMVELLHTATLIHDDVVDDAKERRGIASINAEWNNKISVLIGDFLLSRGLLSAIDGDEFQFLKATSKAVKRMSEGELLSIQKSKDLEVDEEIYFKIISDKTASLMAACCEIGAISACDNEEYHQALCQYGENVGIAFQIRDDIFDYVSKSITIGKPVGNDLKEKKITLPLIHAFSKSDKKEIKKISKLIKSGNMKRKDINYIIDYVNRSNGIEYAREKAIEYSNAAKQSISIFPDSIAKESLLKFADFVIGRNL